MNTADAAPRPPPGFAGVALCGAGATSHVFKATDRRTGQTVALKRLHRHLVRDDEAIARLRRELAALKRLRHPSIVPVRDVIQWQRLPTIVMDFVTGEDLKARIMRDGPLPYDLTERVARALLEALVATHAAGIVHRDIKPQNVRLGEDGGVHLLDFGSARLDASSQLTAAGTTVGTPEYMAPELFAGSVYDPRVDIYGLGATLYECLVGRPPLAADSLAELAYQRATVDPPSILQLTPDAPEGLARVVDRCLARAPEDRFASAPRALWAFDHPHEERARAHRKSVQPPCLHCGTPLPRDASFCPHCQSDRPFSFAPGGYSVTLTGVSDAAGFVEFIADRFPERARPRHLKALAQASLLASSVQPKLIADIEEGQARAFVEALHSIGASTKITVRPSLRKRMLISSAVGFFIACIALPFGYALAMLFLWANLSVGGLFLYELLQARRTGGLLADPKSQVHVASPLVRKFAQYGAVVGAGFVAIMYMIAAGSFLSRDFFAWFGAAGVLGSVTFILAGYGISSARTWGGGKLPRTLCAAPSIWERLFSHSHSEALSTPSPQSRALSLAFAAGALLLVPAEVVVLQRLVRQAPVLVSAEAVQPPAASVRKKPGVQTPSALSLEQQRFARLTRLPPHTRWLLYWPSTVPLVLGVVMLLGFLLVVRKQTRLSREASEILAGADRERLIRAARRIPPSNRRVGRPVPTSGGDAFVGAAVRYAADLESGLSTEDALRMWGAIESLTAGAGASDRQERSLQARCILESDRDQHLRFEFLRLAGELETQAARTWLQTSLESEPEDPLQ